MGKQNDGGEAANVRSRNQNQSELETLIELESLNPDMHYRFVHERPQRQARIRAKGYRAVKASEDGVKPMVEEMIGPDDIIRDGDTILMCCPVDRFKGRRKQLGDLNRSRMAAPKAQFRKKTRGAGPGGEDVRVVTEDKTDK